MKFAAAEKVLREISTTSRPGRFTALERSAA